MNQKRKAELEQVMKECGARDIGDECWEWDGDTVEFVGRIYQHALSHASEVEPNVYWVLFDATTNKKFIKKSLDDGSLAFFDTEQEASRAKARHAGTDYMRVEHYKRPAPAVPVTELVAALNYLLEQTVDQDLAHGLELTEGEQEARQQAIRAIERAGGVS